MSNDRSPAKSRSEDIDIATTKKSHNYTEEDIALILCIQKEGCFDIVMSCDECPIEKECTVVASTSAVNESSRTVATDIIKKLL